MRNVDVSACDCAASTLSVVLVLNPDSQMWHGPWLIGVYLDPRAVYLVYICGAICPSVAGRGHRFLMLSGLRLDADPCPPRTTPRESVIDYDIGIHPSPLGSEHEAMYILKSFKERRVPPT